MSAIQIDVSIDSEQNEIINYKDRLHSLKLQSLEHRRLICDLVLCYKIVHNNLCNDLHWFIQIS